jgi:hypothetical protein
VRLGGTQGIDCVNGGAKKERCSAVAVLTSSVSESGSQMGFARAYDVALAHQTSTDPN